MGRSSLQSLEASKSLAQLLALNAMFDAARMGEAGRESAKVIQAAADASNTSEPADPVCDVLLAHCYAALMENGERPQRFS
ncbi:hypothetical protein VVD49_18240 [Uliginosibacterium sp. H3]|uniref:Uncharacterized protein n=1 Tax=Uliginosibacterium silvisoli TaxID=3114758 RepID=A0ABU6K7Q7_9RHOO|nr:hypothetical protein [Uliginosibacterium sp. H3]